MKNCLQRRGKKAYEEALEDKKIDMAAEVIRQTTSDLINLFRPVMQCWLELQTKKEGETIQNLSESLCKNEVEEAVKDWTA